MRAILCLVPLLPFYCQLTPSETLNSLRHPDNTKCSLVVEKKRRGEGKERGEIGGWGGRGWLGEGEIPAITNAHHIKYIICLPITVHPPPPKRAPAQ